MCWDDPVDRKADVGAKVRKLGREVQDCTDFLTNTILHSQIRRLHTKDPFLHLKSADHPFRSEEHYGLLNEPVTGFSMDHADQLALQ